MNVSDGLESAVILSSRCSSSCPLAGVSMAMTRASSKSTSGSRVGNSLAMWMRDGSSSARVR